MLGRVVKYGVLGGTLLGSGYSLHANDYNVNSVALVRLANAGLAIYDIAWVYKRQLYYREWDKTTSEYAQQKIVCHKIAAERLLELIRTNRGVYIKVGQHIGALEYLLPSEFVQTMKVLHSKAPQNSVEDLFRVIRQDLKRDPREVFDDFEAEPLGTASLAQVHRARLKDSGSVVAVKVQHPYVRGNSIVDMKTMEMCCRLMAWIFPDFNMQWLVEESKRNLPIELDFLNEGRNAEQIASMCQSYKWLKIPKIHWEYSTDRVLVMEYVEGGQVDDLEYMQRHKIDPIEVSNHLGSLYANMIFVNGFVHSDPHPGNILVAKTPRGDTQVMLLDHGLYSTLTDQFRYDYSQLWLSILRVDRPAMREYSAKLGIRGNLYGIFACMVTGRPWEAVLTGIDRTRASTSEKKTIQSETSDVLPQIADVLEHVDRQMLLILKTNDLIRSIETTLGTQNRQTAFSVMSRCCIQTVFRQQQAQTTSEWTRFALKLRQTFMHLKMSLYYTYLWILNSRIWS
ncbi:aarF domain-containing kinase 1-like [Phlebotomus argentipes]|uniref:aarF domain-containing kinase 1-like n=1 Tax=Phlebotomus argentipes TaxID=94469 RepID=UPI0028932B75|nr:aarF domain-containing kinase 1-like [Phlebotomus argentipes]XP_059613167.1 aarF domain-containing kinase 1-like [Phlebotomus argentipes]